MVSLYISALNLYPPADKRNQTLEKLSKTV